METKFFRYVVTALVIQMIQMELAFCWQLVFVDFLG